jgi:hypothetical protein
MKTPLQRIIRFSHAKLCSDEHLEIHSANSTSLHLEILASCCIHFLLDVSAAFNLTFWYIFLRFCIQLIIDGTKLSQSSVYNLSIAISILYPGCAKANSFIAHLPITDPFTRRIPQSTNIESPLPFPLYPWPLEHSSTLRTQTRQVDRWYILFPALLESSLNCSASLNMSRACRHRRKVVQITCSILRTNSQKPISFLRWRTRRCHAAHPNNWRFG